MIRLHNPRSATSIAEVVENGLCIGCGLCESVTHGRVRMSLTDYGALRPSPLAAMTEEEEQLLLSACPGTVAVSRPQADTAVDYVWGAASSMTMAWASDPEVRFESATGGVLTALGVHLLTTEQVGFILHVGPDPDDGLANRWVVSATAKEVTANSGSRYSPTAPLAGLHTALDRNEPFALIAKPCDAAAVHALAQTDPRVDELCTHRLVMVCGGQSRLTKTIGAAKEFGLDPGQVSAVRFRGRGNPGPTEITAKDGTTHSRSYLDMWADESTWDTDSRCTVCPDALGEASDVSASDAWPGGAPVGEDEGFNGVITYSAQGQELMRSAVAAGAITLGESLTPRTFDELQPHQVRKKQALAARYSAMTAAGRPTINTRGLRVEQLGATLTPEEQAREFDGTAVRIARGRYSEQS